MGMSTRVLTALHGAGLPHAERAYLRHANSLPGSSRAFARTRARCHRLSRAEAALPRSSVRAGGAAVGAAFFGVSATTSFRSSTASVCWARCRTCSCIASQARGTFCTGRRLASSPRPCCNISRHSTSHALSFGQQLWLPEACGSKLRGRSCGGGAAPATGTESCAVGAKSAGGHASATQERQECSARAPSSRLAQDSARLVL